MSCNRLIDDKGYLKNYQQSIETGKAKYRTVGP
jgi:hypothetical protein